MGRWTQDEGRGIQVLLFHEDFRLLKGAATRLAINDRQGQSPDATNLPICLIADVSSLTLHLALRHQISVRKLSVNRQRSASSRHRFVKSRRFVSASKVRGVW
ncbi:MAG: hypothetical protein ACK40X_02755, partial [Armatimonadota bacterium]